jgi:hypothetical protein
MVAGAQHGVCGSVRGPLHDTWPTERARSGHHRRTADHAIYERITVAGPEIVGVRLTQAA